LHRSILSRFRQPDGYAETILSLIFLCVNFSFHTKNNPLQKQRPKCTAARLVLNRAMGARVLVSETSHIIILSEKSGNPTTT
jgi:hypothetical protein